MRYNFRRDLFWLLLRPWIAIPRVFQIITTLIILLFELLIQGSSKDAKVQKRLAQNLLNTLTNLGPCFIKVGQALSTRPDLIRRDWLEELTNLQDNLPPFDHNEALKILKSEIGSSADDLFEYFPDKPIASASLGQVYKAKLLNNKWVAVKIQRPNLNFIIRRDIVLIKILGVITGPLLPLNLGVGLGEIIDEFGRSLFEEIDYKKEAKNAEKFAKLFDDNPAIIIPNVEHKILSHKIITTSWIDGVKVRNRADLIANNINPSSIIRTGVISGIKQLLEFGYFHADPHPGNMFALKGSTDDLGHLAYVDFGMMDSISDQDRLILTEAIVNLINQDFNLLAENFQKLGFLKSNQDLKPIEPVLEEVLGGALNKEVSSFNFKEITNKFSELMFDYPFRVPARFALIIRAVVSQEGLAITLDSNFQIIKLAYPYVAKRLLTSDDSEMLNILLQVIFDESNNIRVDRVENLLDVLIQDSSSPAKELIPVAEAGLKLLVSEKGKEIRKNLLMSLIKDEKINTLELKRLIKVIKRKFKPSTIGYGIIRNLNPLTS
tara:strand:+ start:10522 stop:12168 length:1647 start_codon:yes stop_codon:yes gene_type:complete